MFAGIGISSKNIERYDFSISAGAFRDDQIFDSATSPPGRFLIEVGRRVLRAMPGADVIAIGNPLVPLRADQIASWLEGIGGALQILTDQARFPLLYVFPRSLIAEQERFLLALSCVDAQADQRLLELVTGKTFEVRHTQLPPVATFPPLNTSNWVNPGDKHAALRLHCFNAIRTIERNDRWRTLPFANFHPNHAGDVLFVSMASHDVRTPLFQKHVVCSSYLDIVKACRSKLETMRLRLPWMPRVTWISETQYFGHALERLGQEAIDENFIIFTRFLRRYRASTFHLIDQNRFCLGDSMESADRTVHVTPCGPEDHAALPSSPLSVLLHLSGGGWPIKAYPRHRAANLCSVLKGLGCDVEVVDDPALAEQAGIKSLVCDDTELLSTAIKRHHIFMGIDSFPHHFARHVLGWPTIGLFGDTKPCNSNALQTPTYRALAGSLPCMSCGAQDVCPVFGRRDCSNFPPVKEVVETLFEMAASIYGIAITP